MTSVISVVIIFYSDTDHVKKVVQSCSSHFWNGSKTKVFYALLAWRSFMLLHNLVQQKILSSMATELCYFKFVQNSAAKI